MTKPRICFLTDYMTTGGLEKVVCQAIEILHTDYDITVQALFGGVDKNIAEMIGTKAKIISETKKFGHLCLASVPLAGGWYLKHLLKDRYDFLIVLRPWFVMAPYSFAATKVIYWCHSDKDTMYAERSHLGFIRKLNWLRLRMGYRRFDAVWVVNDYIREKIKTAFGIRHVLTLHNPIEFSVIEEYAQEPTEEDVFASDAINFVSVGRLSAEKGHLRLLQAMRDLKDTYKCRLVLVGDGDQRTALEEKVSLYGLENGVHFLGSKENPYPYMRSADALVIPSRIESFGLVALEAMAVRTPIIMTDTIGGRIVTDQGKYGLLIDNSTEGVVDGMRRFLEDPDYGHSDTDRAYEWAHTFDIGVFAERIKALLQ